MNTAKLDIKNTDTNNLIELIETAHYYQHFLRNPFADEKWELLFESKLNSIKETLIKDGIESHNVFLELVNTMAKLNDVDAADTSITSKRIKKLYKSEYRPIDLDALSDKEIEIPTPKNPFKSLAVCL